MGMSASVSPGVGVFQYSGLASDRKVFFGADVRPSPRNLLLYEKRNYFNNFVTHHAALNISSGFSETVQIWAEASHPSKN